MKVYVVSAMLEGELIGCLGAFSTRKKAEERIAQFKNGVEEDCYFYGEDLDLPTFAEITEVGVED